MADGNEKDPEEIDFQGENEIGFGNDAGERDMTATVDGSDLIPVSVTGVVAYLAYTVAVIAFSIEFWQYFAFDNWAAMGGYAVGILVISVIVNRLVSL